MLRRDIKSQQHLLRELATTATSMIVSCRDDFLCESTELNLSNLNQQWDDVLIILDNLEVRLKSGIALAVRYEQKRSDFDSWVCACESKIAHLQHEGIITLQDPFEAVKVGQIMYYFS